MNSSALKTMVAQPVFPDPSLKSACARLLCAAVESDANVGAVLNFLHDRTEVFFFWNQGESPKPVQLIFTPDLDLIHAARPVVGSISSDHPWAKKFARVLSPQSRSFQLIREAGGSLAIALGFFSNTPPFVPILESTAQEWMSAASAVWAAEAVAQLRLQAWIESEGLLQQAIDRAKRLLQQSEGISAASAYERLKRLSWQHRRPLAVIAQDVLDRRAGVS